MYSAIKIVLTDNSNRDLVDMLMASHERCKKRKGFCNPDIVTQ